MPNQANKRDDLLLATFDFCSAKARRLSSFSMGNSSHSSDVEVPLLDADLEWDTDEMWDSANDQLVITRIGSSGLIIVTANLEYAANATGGRGLYLYINGGQNSVCVSDNASAAKPTRISMCIPIWEVEIGDTYKLYGWQDSGGNLNVTYASLAIRVLP